MNKNYPLNQVDRITNLKELLEGCAKKYADQVAFRFREKDEEFQKTYSQLLNDVKHLGTALLDMNVKASHIVVIGENSYEWIITYFAAVSTGNVIVPLDKELNTKEIVGLLREADCKVFVYTSKYREAAKEAEQTLGSSLILIDMESKESNGTSEIYELIDRGSRLIASGYTEFSNIKINDEQLAAIHYTSGTTGISKGVMLTHKNIVADVIGALETVQICGSTVLILPLHHTFGISAGVLCMLHNGTCICINNSMKRIAGDLKYYKPYYVPLVPLYVEALYDKIWKTAESSGKSKQLRMLCNISDALLSIGIDLRKQLFKRVLEGFGGELKLIVCGGALLDPKYIKGFRSFGINVLNGYGITECSPIVSVNRNDYYRDGSVGVVLPCCQVKINEPDEHGEGEILVTGDCVMKGYYKNESETAKVFTEGWFKTGDIGRLDEDGFLYITGRSKNIIILSNGKNIYPEELEMYINGIPFVKETLVYAEKDDNDYEVSIVAEVYLDDEYAQDKSRQALETELTVKIDELNKTLPLYKNINKVKVRDTEFEKTTSKKIKRAQHKS